VTAASIADLVDAAGSLVRAADAGNSLGGPIADLERVVASRHPTSAAPISPRAARARTYTRTRTFYFSEDRVAPLSALLDDLEADWEHRRPHIDADIADAGAARLGIVRAGLALLLEPVAE
jgi:hypothetical protein